MAHEKLLQELDERRAKAAAMGGEEKLSKRHNRGQLNAWQRMEVLVDEGSFIETGLLGASSIVKADEQRTPRDGKIVGFAKIDGRDIGLCVNDFTVKGASTSATNSKKMAHARRVASHTDSEPVEPPVMGAFGITCDDESAVAMRAMGNAAPSSPRPSVAAATCVAFVTRPCPISLPPCESTTEPSEYMFTSAPM